LFLSCKFAESLVDCGAVLSFAGAVKLLHAVHESLVFIFLFGHIFSTEGRVQEKLAHAMGLSSSVEAGDVSTGGVAREVEFFGKPFVSNHLLDPSLEHVDTE